MCGYPRVELTLVGAVHLEPLPEAGEEEKVRRREPEREQVEQPAGVVHGVGQEEEVLPYRTPLARDSLGMGPDPRTQGVPRHHRPTRPHVHRSRLYQVRLVVPDLPLPVVPP